MVWRGAAPPSAASLRRALGRGVACPRRAVLAAGQRAGRGRGGAVEAQGAVPRDGRRLRPGRVHARAPAPDRARGVSHAEQELPAHGAGLCAGGGGRRRAVSVAGAREVEWMCCEGQRDGCGQGGEVFGVGW